MEKKKPLVIVLSRNYSTGLSVIRSVGAAGYEVDLVASAYKKGTSRIAASSKYVRNAVEVVSKKVSEDGDQGLIDELLKLVDPGDNKPVIFPTDDYTTSVMDQNRSILEPYFIMPTIVGGGDNCLTEMMDKTVQAKLAKEAGLLIPQEWMISLEDEQIVIPEDMIYPCFVKPIESVSGYKREMAKCATEEALLKHLQKLQNNFPHRSILVQEFLDIDHEIDLSGVCLDEKIIIPAVIKKWNVAKYERGVTLAGKVVPFEELGDLQEKIVSMLKKFHYMGMFDMELNLVGDKVYFNEVNLRSGGPNYAYFKSGVNLPALFVKAASGEAHDPQEELVTTYGQSFVYEKIAWEDYIKGHMTKQALKDRLAAADFTLLNDPTDPKPGRIFAVQMRLSAAWNRLKKWKRRCVKSLKRMKRTLLRWFNPAIKLLRKAKYTLLGYPQAKKANRRNPFAERPRVVVAGRNYCSNLCMARSVGQAGYQVEVLRIFQVRPQWTNLMKLMKPDAHSDYIKAYHVCISNRKSKNVVKKLVQIADPYRKMLLIPADDLMADIIDTYYTKLSQYYVMPNVNNTKGAVNHLMSKEVQKQMAEDAGLPVVNSCVIRARKGIFQIPASVTYPCFIKPNISKNSSKSRMRRCDNEAELRAALTEFSQKKAIEMLVEDFVEIGQEYAILGLSTKDGVVAPGYFVAEEGGHDERRGVAMIGRIVPCSEEQKLIDDITRFVASLGFDGLFDVDLIKTKDGKMYFTELNLRFGASGYAVTQSGVNLPGMFADYMLMGKPIDLNCHIAEPGKRFISEKVMIEEYIKGYLTKEDMAKHMADVDIHFVLNENDPKPYKHFKKFYAIADLMRRYHQIKGD